VEKSLLITEPIPALIRRISMPAGVGFLFNTLYNAVDTFFGGLISTQAVASLSVTFPVFFIIIAMGTGVSTGTTALIANALGAGRAGEARSYALQGIVFGILTGIALTVLGTCGSPLLLTMLGASDDYLVMAVTYINTIFLGAVLFMLLYMFNAVLNGMGETRPFRNFLMAGFLMNLVLDPWFIYGGLGLPAMGIFGIALATVVIQGIGCIYLGYEVRKTGLVSNCAVWDFLPKPGPFKEMARQGLPASFNMLTVGIGIFVITYFVSRFGKEAVAAYGIAMRIEQIFLVPTIGLNVATLALVAQNNGAGLYDRVRETLRKCLKYGAWIMAGGSLVILVAARVLMGLFTRDETVIGMGAVYLRIDALVLYAYVLLFVHVAALQGMKRPMFAVWIGLYRQIAAPIALFWLLTRVFTFGLLGIWWGIFAITWSAAVITLLYARATVSRKTALKLQPEG
jgi:putative MATE family efflux protein